jgi:hypothetical protein
VDVVYVKVFQSKIQGFCYLQAELKDKVNFKYCGAKRLSGINDAITLLT